MILKRRGNPTWASGVLARPSQDVPEFERVAARLRLKPDEYVSSNELRAWAEANKDTRYVPERLLKAWGIPVRRNIEDFV